MAGFSYSSSFRYNETMAPIISVSNLSKTYASGFRALKNINLDIRAGEIFALLGPNGAGKTTLISIICGIVNASEGQVRVAGRDINKDYRITRAMIGLVPQELTTDAFETVWGTVTFSRRLFGHRDNPNFIAKVLRDLSLWDKKDSEVRTLSGGMKRRLLIAKALSHEPQILFLDEPTAGVDIELRKDMWELVRQLRASGVTIILTTHYIDEAEAMADRIGIVDKGELILVEDKAVLMHKLGKKQLRVHLRDRITAIPPTLSAYGLHLSEGGDELIYGYATQGGESPVPALLEALMKTGLAFTDITTNETKLEDIFVDLVGQRK
jgi:ABC-2 type transport system ATP-binding protein